MLSYLIITAELVLRLCGGVLLNRVERSGSGACDYSSYRDGISWFLFFFCQFPGPFAVERGWARVSPFGQLPHGPVGCVGQAGTICIHASGSVIDTGGDIGLQSSARVPTSGVSRRESREEISSPGGIIPASGRTNRSFLELIEGGDKE